MCLYRKDIEDPFDFSNSQLLEFLTSFFLRLRALAPPVALGNSNNSSKLISLSQKMKLSLQRSTFFSESQSSFHFSMFSLSLFTVRENVEEEALYRGRADQISILGPKEEKKQLSRSFPNDAAPNISSFLTFPLQGQGEVSVYQKHSEQNKALLLRLLSLLSPAFSSNLFSIFWRF